MFYLGYTQIKSSLHFTGKLPPIIPIVIYQGEATWTAKVGFQDLVYIPFEGLRPYIPNFQYFLDDVSNVDVEEFKESVIIKCWHVICKYLRTPELRSKLPEIVSLLFDFLEKDKATEYLDIFFKYLANATDVIKKEDVKKSLKKLPQGGEDIMRTWADEFRDEGRNEGIIIGEQKGELRGELRGELKTVRQLLLVTLQDRFDLLPQSVINDIKRIESPETLNELFRRTLRCESLEQFKGWIDKALGLTVHELSALRAGLKDERPTSNFE